MEDPERRNVPSAGSGGQMTLSIETPSKTTDSTDGANPVGPFTNADAVSVMVTVWRGSSVPNPSAKTQTFQADAATVRKMAHEHIDKVLA